jgi:hypothetical protein
MAVAQEFEEIAMSLEGTTQAPHFDRTAFKVKRIYATLAADGKSANLNFSPDEQELRCLTNPDAFAPIDNAWGRQGWTTMTLAKVDSHELRAALEIAWQHALGKKKP